LLTNLETNQRKLLQIVLIGQPELRTMLGQPELEQLAQRVIARYHLGALTEAETVKYLRHRLGVAGLTGANPFTRRAMQRIHLRSRGVPRRINLLADRALLGAYADGLARVDHRIVDKAAAEVFGAGAQLQALRRAAPWGLGLVAGVALAGGVALWLQRERPAPAAMTATPATSASAARAMQPAAASSPAATTSAPAASATIAVASAAPAAPAAPASPLFLIAADLPARFGPPLRREDDAWRALAALWRISLPEASGDPCVQAPPWQCFKSANGGLPLIRQLDRPGFITLHDDAGRPLHVLLVALGDRTATLHIGSQTQTVSLVSLANVWQGDFATFWQAPGGYQRTLGDGDTGTLVDHLAAQLASVRGEAPPQARQRYDAALKSRVQAFQLANGLKADGLAGPTTFMQLARAAGDRSEPRLIDGR
jgi:general secretion pathway protein A